MPSGNSIFLNGSPRSVDARFAHGLSEYVIDMIVLYLPSVVGPVLCISLSSSLILGGSCGPLLLIGILGGNTGRFDGLGSK